MATSVNESSKVFIKYGSIKRKLHWQWEGKKKLKFWAHKLIITTTKTTSCHACLLTSRFDADNPVSMCQKNAAVAAALNRPDLVQVNLVVDVHLCVNLSWYLILTNMSWLFVYIDFDLPCQLWTVLNQVGRGCGQWHAGLQKWQSCRLTNACVVSHGGIMVKNHANWISSPQSTFTNHMWHKKLAHFASEILCGEIVGIAGAGFFCRSNTRSSLKGLS